MIRGTQISLLMTIPPTSPTASTRSVHFIHTNEPPMTVTTTALPKDNDEQMPPFWTSVQCFRPCFLPKRPINALATLFRVVDGAADHGMAVDEEL